MNRLGTMHFFVGILAFFLLLIQAVIGIMMFVGGSDSVPMNVGQPANRSTEAAADSTKTTPNETSGNMGTPPQGGANGSITPGEMPNGGGFQRGNSLAGKYIDFYHGAGGLVASIILLIIGGAGIVIAIMSRKTEAKKC
ncbi:hypothetical protein GW626_22480 [Peribacillus muralis]|uniref:hypothetical protein n=1 Tax=Peribacillus muralis TaxID=264697 RepID=UPI001F4EBA79|nr:hypothetical protein [Peribacillus muralis]MCK1994654.1 hypothetical protein [Peribacillus muralis]MCK2015111.1 hypothetical protein [Peribacillus muralis]